MKKISQLFIIIALFISTTTFANSEIISANQFSTVKKLILAQKDPQHLLLALDDDDTLTMMPCPDVTHCQYLGGPAWFSWQMTLSKNNPDRVWKTFHELISINNLIFNMSRMVLDDPAIPDTLQTADHRGAHIMMVTARGYSSVDVTERQLSQNHILKLIEKNAIHTSSGHISYPGFYLPEKWNQKSVRPIAYDHGVLYVAGLNKGEMLKQFLAKTNETKNIRTIIFVDDTMQNVIDVANAYKNNPNVHVISIHFTRLAAHKAALTKGKNAKRFQHEATKQWDAIKNVMRKNLIRSEF